jgi:hypothetical protein
MLNYKKGDFKMIKKKIVSEKTIGDVHIIPNTEKNIALLKALLCISAKREGIWVDLDVAIDVQKTEAGVGLSFWSGNQRVDMCTTRALLKAWVEGRIDGLPAPQYPVILWIKKNKAEGKLVSLFGLLDPQSNYSVVYSHPKKYSKLQF